MKDVNIMLTYVQEMLEFDCFWGTVHCWENYFEKLEKQLLRIEFKMYNPFLKVFLH